MITNAIIEILDQGLSVLSKISDKDYDIKLSLVYGGTIGGHYRHVLEHFSSLYSSHTSGVINYDLRERNLDIEENRLAAIKATNEIKDLWSSINPALYRTEMELVGKLSLSNDMKVKTTLEREMVYAIAHAQHHYAIIGVMCSLLECPVGEGFGVAPSTMKHRESQGQEALSVS